MKVPNPYANYWLICTIVGAFFIMSGLGCKKDSGASVGCTNSLATNYNGKDSCMYNGSAYFYVDVGILPSGSSPILVALDNSPSSQGQPIYNAGSAACGGNGASFTENWKDSSSKIFTYKAYYGSAYPVSDTGNWTGTVTLTANQCTPVLLPAGGVTFYTSNSSYVTSVLNDHDILVNMNICSCQLGITQAYSSAPSYGASGCVSFFLPLGTYNYTAFANAGGSYYKTWTGSFSITTDKQQLTVQLQ
jgi:hypothetical protein